MKSFLAHTPTYHLLSDGVVCCLKVAEHLSYNLLGIAAITHGIQQISCPLSNTHIPLSLQRHRETNKMEERRCDRGRDTSTDKCISVDCSVLLNSIPLYPF